MGNQNRTWKSRLGLGLLLNIGIALIFTLSALFLLEYLKDYEQNLALVEAESKAALILDRNLAIHTYFTHQLKPDVFELTDPVRAEDYFEPSWMSSTYAVREIDKYYQSLENEGYYYKECAIDARSPENEADAFEKAFIEEINTNPELNYRSQVRNLDGETYFVVLRRGEIMEESCLRCHSIPENAPKALVDVYGPERSFGRNAGETVSAISIRVPVSGAYTRAERSSKKLSYVFLSVLLTIFVIQYLFYTYLLCKPLKKMHGKALQISENDSHLGERVDLPVGRELYDMADTFNAMSERLKDHIEDLEDLVAGRTIELTRTNDKLKQEVSERTKANKDLQDALTKVKKLSGLLPICSSCKNIRNDKGYWQQVESYLQEYSDVRFSHGMCEKCEEKLYGTEEWYLKRKARREAEKGETSEDTS